MRWLYPPGAPVGLLVGLLVGLGVLLGGRTLRPAHADSPWLDGAPAAVTDDTPRPLVGFQVRGDSKVTNRTLRYLARATPGELVTAKDLPRFHAALLSSELFKTIAVTLERSGDGVMLVATVDDKHSWIIVPTLYVLSGYKSVGLGFAENNLGGENRKLLLYGQLGDLSSFFFGTYLDPSVRGTRWTTRIDLYPLRRRIYEFVNPASDPASVAIARESTMTFLNAGILVGYNFAWWLNADARVRGAYTYFRNARLGDGTTPTTIPEVDGWDVTLQTRVTIDRRDRDRGITRGGYLQASVEASVPGLDTYGYQAAIVRGFYNFRLFAAHHLELRASVALGRHLPLHEELEMGGATDVRGYLFDQFRGDTRVFAKAEYSVPLFRYRWFTFRALGFFDTGYIGYHNRRPSGRDYLPSEAAGMGWWRNDVGGGLRLYVNNIVLPLLGIDLGYGLERRDTALYFQIGLTDF